MVKKVISDAVLPKNYNCMVQSPFMAAFVAMPNTVLAINVCPAAFGAFIIMGCCVDYCFKKVK